MRSGGMPGPPTTGPPTTRPGEGAACEAQLPIFLGSDTPNPGVVPGESLLREMELWVGLGIPREEVWRRVTLDAARVLGVPQLGTLAPGAPADLLLFAQDPTRDADATLVAVVADGRLYRVSELEASLDAMRAHFERAPYAWVTRTLARALLGLSARLGSAHH